MSTHPEPLPIGAEAPAFELTATDGSTVSLASIDAKVFVYVQGCNHCPMVLAYLDRLKDYAREYEGRGVRFVMVNSNDPERYPDDDFASMKTFARENDLPFAYLHDPTQEVARAYRTFRTPELLVFDADRRLAYHGRIDDNRDPTAVTTSEFRDALEALLQDERPPVAETYAVGCTVKWKPGNEPVPA